MTVASEAAGRGGTLVIQPLPGIGDVVWHLPHLKALAAASPDGRVTLMARPRTRAAELLEGVDHHLLDACLEGLFIKLLERAVGVEGLRHLFVGLV